MFCTLVDTSFQVHCHVYATGSRAWCTEFTYKAMGLYFFSRVFIFTRVPSETISLYFSIRVFSSASVHFFLFDVTIRHQYQYQIINTNPRFFKQQKFKDQQITNLLRYGIQERPAQINKPTKIEQEITTGRERERVAERLTRLESKKN
uniref:Uncharacterized protein n=1 Tax=Rhizophora mucronata TaxID=61149 RepID=A0A2P2P0T9_RHIMU